MQIEAKRLLYFPLFVLNKKNLIVAEYKEDKLGNRQTYLVSYHYKKGIFISKFKPGKS